MGDVAQLGRRRVQAVGQIGERWAAGQERHRPGEGVRRGTVAREGLNGACTRLPVRDRVGEAVFLEIERMILGQRTYGAVRNYEMWLVQQRAQPSAEVQAVVRQTFTDANAALRRGDVPAARAAYTRARAMVDQLRRPVIAT